MIEHAESMPAIDEALRDESLLGAALGDPKTWTTWLAVLCAAFGLPLDAEQLEIFFAVAGGRAPPTQRVRELWAIIGRRAGKSRVAAAIAVFLAIFVRYRLAAGEHGMVLVLAASQEQARVVFAYAKAFLQTSPVLRQEVVDVTRSEIRLRNGITLAIHSNSFRTIRGRTLCACVFDEVAIWHDESSSAPDSETYTAVLPSLLTTHGMLVGISTGYRRLGLLYGKYRDHFGVASSDTLVVQGSTLQFNQSLTETDIAAQRAADPAAAASEWDGGFRDGIASLFDDELIDAAVDHGRPLELPPQIGVCYQMFVDASSGVGADAYSIAVAHKEGTKNACFVVDVVRGTSGKFDPQQVTKDYATLAKQYRIGSVVGDHYAAEWVAGAWRDCGITYSRSDLPKSQLYLEALPLFTRGLARLPDHPRLVRELRLLERRTHRSGKDTVDHPRNGRDDHANCVAGVLRNLSNYLGHNKLDYSGWCDKTPDDPHGIEGWRRMRLANYLYSGGLIR
jgi:hypothetical protein